MEIIIIFLIICVAFGIYVIINLLNKLEKTEDYIEQQEKNIITLLETLRVLDSKQMFEKDDEVGSLFVQIKNIIENFKQ
jgi:lipoate-protein ligase B